MKKERRENDPQQTFDRLVNLLRWGAEEYGLGWDRQIAHLELDLNPEHLSQFSPEQIHSERPSFAQPNVGSILRHLLHNCGEHTGIEGKEMQISIKSKREEGLTSIEVCDNGPGIPTLGRRKVAIGSIARHRGSNLVLAQKEVWRLGGNVVVENRINNRGKIEGAKFTVMLPVVR